MINEIVSKIKNNNYQRVNVNRWSGAKAPVTSFAEINHVTTGVGNGDTEIQALSMTHLINEVKMH